MKIRKLAAIAAGMAMALAPTLVNSPAQAAGAAECAIAGSVSLNPGVGPGGGPGTYAFVTTTITCAGVLGTTVVGGSATATSTGTYTDLLGAGGTFAGAFGTGVFPIGGIACSGTISGARVGAVVEAQLNGTCGGVAGIGTVELTFVPFPASCVSTTPPRVTCAAMQGSGTVASVP